MEKEFKDALSGLLSIPSVAIDGDEKYPFGENCAKALDYMLDLCDKFGFRTKKCSNLLGWAEVGEGDELVGILAHLDVVPEGTGWEYPAFSLTEVGDRIYGRGISDDKGPAMMCVFAMKKLLDSKHKFGRRVRIIFGLTEERGEWIDMEWYKAHEELPTFGFTPDASFPAVYGEKGILVLNLKMPLEGSGVDEIFGGQAHNMVADICKAKINGEEFSAHGKSAHGSLPHKGVNAILKLMGELNVSNPGKLTKFMTEKFGNTCDGSLINCALSDKESGALTLNVGMISSENNEINITIDIRYPVTLNGDDITEIIKKECAPYGVKVEKESDSKPIYTDKNGQLITSLMEVYRSVTNDDTRPFVMGGGTYARAMPNIVAFGPLFPQSPETEHQKNEYMLTKDIDTARKIYELALNKLTLA